MNLTINIFKALMTWLKTFSQVIYTICQFPFLYIGALINKFKIIFVEKRFSAKSQSAEALINTPIQSSNNQPPDLDEVFEQWKKKLDKLFKDLSGGSGNNSNNTSPKIPQIRLPKTLLLIAVIAFIVVGWLISGFYSIDANERGIVMQFGRYIKTTDPGWQWRLPYPFQSHLIVDLSTVRTFEISGTNNQTGAQMLTSDENIIQVQFSVQYDVADPYKYAFIDLNPEDTARLAAETAMREVVGNSTMDRVLSENREDVARAVRDSMQNILESYQVGLRVIRVNLQSVNPPADVQAAFDDVIKARQDLDRQVNEGQAYQQKVVPQARGQASRMTEDAQAYKQEVIARAEGEASRFNNLYSEYRLAKDVTRERLYLETMGDILSNSKKIVVDPSVRSIINLGSSDSQNNSSNQKVLPIIEDNTGSSPPANSSQNKTPAQLEIDRRRRK